MDEQQNLDSHSLKDRAWTTDEIRKHSSNWTLAGDVGLFNLLNEFSHNIISRTHEVENAVDSLVHQTKMTSAKINNVINDFHMLSNLQFVENRVYDEEVHEQVHDTKPSVEKTKEQREAAMMPKIMKAIELGLSVLDTAFNHINVNEISDSEDEEDISSEGRTILEPKDPYEHRPLPYIIGSEEFMKCDYAGLKDLVEEEVQSFSEESSLSESDEISSDEGEPLPLDDEPVSPKLADQISQNISDMISSSDESELFGSEKEENNVESDSSLDLKPKEVQPIPEIQPEKKSRPSSVSSMQAKLKLPQVLPVYQVPKIEKKEEDIFANDEPSDDESPFRKKTGLFTSDIRFDEDEEKDGDLFGGDLFQKLPSKDTKEIKTVDQPKKQATEIIQEKKKQGLFENEEDSDEDIFNTLMKTKKPTSKTNAESQDSSEKADSLSTPSSAPSIRSVGNAFGFASASGPGDTLFGDDSDGDDLFANKKSSERKKFDLDTPDDKDDLFGIISSKPKTENKTLTSASSSLFDNSKPSEKEKLKLENESTSAAAKPKKDSLFDDDIFTEEKPFVPSHEHPITSNPKKKQSLFDDDDFDDDIFTQAKKPSEPSKVKEESSNLFKDEPKQPKKQLEPAKKIKEESSSLFKDGLKQPKKQLEPAKKIKEESSSLFSDEPKQMKTELKTQEKSRNISPFDDTDEDDTSKSLLENRVSKSSLFQNELEKALSKDMKKKQGLQVPKKEPSLFEDSGDFDLFTTKPSSKDLDKKITELVPEAKSGSIKLKDEVDGPKNSKVLPVRDTITDSQSSFDKPVDNSNMLNSVNKSRARITTKRRKPTRQGRLAAIEKTENEEPSTQPTSVASDNSALDEVSDNLFIPNTVANVEPPKLGYKAQEKEKMNLMSQLMSEVTASKVGPKNSVLEDADEEIDIFSEAAKKDRSKSSFSFLPPEQNGIASVFPVGKTEGQVDNNLEKSDSFEDDFFTEPAFKNFRSSVSSKDPPAIDLEDDEGDDDLFSTIKTSILPKAKQDGSKTNDIFEDDDDDVDIFADAQKEKYEMFPSQIYEDEDDDIFGSISNVSSSKSSNAKNTTVKKAETHQVDAFEDPLTGLLGGD